MGFNNNPVNNETFTAGGKSFKYNTSTKSWNIVNTITNLSDISDVSSTVPTVNDTLLFNGTEWAPSQLSNGTAVASTINSTGSTTGSSATNAFVVDQSLIYDTLTMNNFSEDYNTVVDTNSANSLVSTEINKTNIINTAGADSFTTYKKIKENQLINVNGVEGRVKITSTTSHYVNKPHTQNIARDTILGRFSLSTQTLPISVMAAQVLMTSTRVYLIGGSAGNLFNTVYSAIILSNGEIGGWRTEAHALPANIINAQSCIIGSKMYLISGYTDVGIHLSSVYSTTISADGSLGVWGTETNSLPIGVSRAQLVVTKSRIYLLGGYNASGALNTILSAPIDVNGIGAWITETNVLPAHIHQSQSIVTNSRVYLLSGTSSNMIYYAAIDSSGNIGTWQTDTNSSPDVYFRAQVILIKNKVYLFSGYNGPAGYNNYIYSAPISNAGVVGSWTTETNIMPTNLANSQLIVTKTKAYLMGGNNNGGVTNKIWSAPINGWRSEMDWSRTELTVDTSTITNGSIPNNAFIDEHSAYSTIVLQDAIDTSFTGLKNSGVPFYANYEFNNISYSTVPDMLKSLVKIKTGDKLAIVKNDLSIHETTANSVVSNEVYLNKPYCQNNNDITIGPWTADNISLPYATTETQIIVTSSKIYVLVCYSSTDTAVQYQILSADFLYGEIGPWRVESTIPNILNFKAIATKSKVYLIGDSTTYSALIDTNGLLGTWNIEPNSLPFAIRYCEVILTRSHIYVLGGEVGGVSTNKIYSTPIDTNGNIGIWSVETNTLPVNLSQMESVVTKSRVYLLGSHTVSNKIYSAPIDTNGVIGSWITETNVIPESDKLIAVTTHTKIYLIGSGNGNNIIYSAPIDNLGIIGSWTTEQYGLPSGGYSGNGHIIVGKSKIYIIGFSDGQQIFSAPINNQNYFHSNSWMKTEYEIDTSAITQGEIPNNVYSVDTFPSFEIGTGNGFQTPAVLNTQYDLTKMPILKATKTFGDIVATTSARTIQTKNIFASETAKLTYLQTELTKV